MYCSAIASPAFEYIKWDCDEFEIQAVTVSKTNFTASSSISHNSSNITIRTFLSSVTLIHIHSMFSKANVVTPAISWGKRKHFPYGLCAHILLWSHLIFRPSGTFFNAFFCRTYISLLFFLNLILFSTFLPCRSWYNVCTFILYCHNLIECFLCKFFNMLNNYYGQSLPWMRWTCSFISLDIHWQVGTCPSPSKAVLSPAVTYPEQCGQKSVLSNIHSNPTCPAAARQTYLSA